MIYVCYNYSDQSFTVATNIKAIAEETGIPYHRAYRLLSNGEDSKQYKNFLLGKSDELIKGNQRIHAKKTKKQDNNLPGSQGVHEADKSGADGEVQDASVREEGAREDGPERERPDNRNEWDDFFKMI